MEAYDLVLKGLEYTEKFGFAPKIIGKLSLHQGYEVDPNMQGHLLGRHVRWQQLEWFQKKCLTIGWKTLHL